MPCPLVLRQKLLIFVKITRCFYKYCFLFLKFVHILIVFVQSNVQISMEKSFIGLIEQSIKENWDRKALTDYRGATLQYKDLARKIEKIHLCMKEIGIKPGDKIALCGRNSAHWCVGFLSIITYGAVVVPILHEFKADNIHNIVNHSESRMLFVGDQVWENLNEELMPNIEGVISLADFSILVSRSEQLVYTREHLNEMFGSLYPCRFLPEMIQWRRENPEELAIINYTSGTTGYSKGVMLPYRSLLSNVLYCREMIGIKAGDRIVSMLPLGHVFGMTFDFLYGITSGAHLWFLTRMPSPKIIAESFAEIKPRIISSVPLVIEKIFKKNILPRVDHGLERILFQLPHINNLLKVKIRNKAMEVFGNNFMEIIIGGAPFNAEVEAFMRKIEFPYTAAYGMTECGPIITHVRYDQMRPRTCGQAASRMEVKVLSADPQNIPGELVCRGENLMMGYYKDPESTQKVIDSEGWLHTGDMAVVDNEGYFYIKGRCKNMLLTASGQNIYPEEIEAKLNNLPYISESVVILHNDKLVALIYPDLDDAHAHNLSPNDLYNLIDGGRQELNKELPVYSQIARVKLWPEEFEKTAKKSIKRYLYQNIEA